jgi:isopenicillin-N epimerase
VKDLFLLDPGVVFLNHGSFGACPRPVFERYQEWQRTLEREPVAFLARERGFGDLFEQARLRLAAYLGADPGNIVFTPNATTGLNAAVRSLALEPGDVVLTGDREYGGLLRLWEFVARRTGVRIESAPFDELDPGPETRVVFCSHVEWTSGRVNDVAELCRRAREAGAVSIVDGAHAPGQVELDLEAIGADVYCGNCHKWMCGPKGSGFLYVRPELHQRIDPSVVSWDWEDGAPFADVHRWQGTRDPSAYLAVPDAIDFQHDHDWPEVRAGSHLLLERARELLPLEPLTDRFVQMLGFRIDHPDAAGLTRRLYAEHRVEVPVFESAGDWVLRVSAQAYNDEEDIDVLTEALASVGVR